MGRDRQLFDVRPASYGLDLPPQGYYVDLFYQCFYIGKRPGWGWWWPTVVYVGAGEED
jgi:hypothetical protein